MPLVSLSIEQFRNLAPVSLRFSPQLNLFIGPNAAGKTSLLESLFVLARARSFRTRSLTKAIQAGKTGFQLVATVETSQSRQIPVGLGCSQKKLVARIDGQPATRLSQLAGLFPVQWLGGNLHRLIEEGPVYRRQYLDWGLFHVKPTYGEAWKRFQKLLKQRNAALRAGVSAREINVWDHELANSGEELHHLRQAYVCKLIEVVRSVSRQLLTLDEDVQVSYHKGWASQRPYIEALRAGLERDREHRYTRSGPQRADLAFLYQDRRTVDTFSRGQQKLLVLALQVAQASLLRQETLRTSLFLMDDLGAELDEKNQQRVMRLLHSIEAQAFVTAIDDPGVSNWDMDSVSRFHVKHGSVSEVLYSPG